MAAGVSVGQDLERATEPSERLLPRRRGARPHLQHSTVLAMQTIKEHFPITDEPLTNMWTDAVNGLTQGLQLRLPTSRGCTLHPTTRW